VKVVGEGVVLVGCGCAAEAALDYDVKLGRLSSTTDLGAWRSNYNASNIYIPILKTFNNFRHHGLMVRRCFPVAKIVGSSPTGVAFVFAFALSLTVSVADRIIFLSGRMWKLPKESSETLLLPHSRASWNRSRRTVKAIRPNIRKRLTSETLTINSDYHMLRRQYQGSAALCCTVRGPADDIFWLPTMSLAVF
jgi:hypothetical protein